MPSTLLFVIPVIAGLVIGLLSGGRIRTDADAGLRATWLLWAAAAVQVGGLATRSPGVPTLLAVYALVLCWIGVNLPGRTLAVRLGLSGVLVGLVANGLAIAVNGRMPYAPAAAAAVGIADGTSSMKNAPASVETLLPWLGDVLPVAPLGAVISIGDIAIAVGIAVLVPALMTIRSGNTETSRGGDLREPNP